MLQPKRTKFRKQMKGHNRGIATRGNKVSFGEFGLKAVTRGRITARQIEAALQACRRRFEGGCRHRPRQGLEVQVGTRRQFDGR